MEQIFSALTGCTLPGFSQMGGGAFYSFAVDATHEAGYEAYGDGDLKVNVANDAGTAYFA